MLPEGGDDICFVNDAVFDGWKRREVVAGAEGGVILM